MADWRPYDSLPEDEQDLLVRELCHRTRTFTGLIPRTRFKCDCCRHVFDNEVKRRQMKFVPVDVCTSCASRMETKH